MAKAKSLEPKADSPALPDPEHELNPDVYRAPEPSEPEAVEQEPIDD